VVALLRLLLSGETMCIALKGMRSDGNLGISGKTVNAGLRDGASEFHHRVLAESVLPTMEQRWNENGLQPPLL
jgi:hypothetical protein